MGMNETKDGRTDGRNHKRKQARPAITSTLTIFLKAIHAEMQPQLLEYVYRPTYPRSHYR